MVRTSPWMPLSRLCFGLDEIPIAMPDESEASFAGVEESNHGRVPEIYVAVYSDRVEDVTPRYGYSLSKRKIIGRLKKNNGEFRISKGHGVNFRYLIATQENKDFLARKGLKPDRWIRIAALSAFAKALHRQDLFLADGVLDRDDIDKIRLLVPPHLFPKRIGAMPNADMIYPLVNTAHHVAYALHNYYSGPITQSTEYIFPESRVGLCLEELLRV